MICGFSEIAVAARALECWFGRPSPVKAVFVRRRIGCISLGRDASEEAAGVHVKLRASDEALNET
jgi:hypothetical protein